MYPELAIWSTHGFCRIFRPHKEAQPMTNRTIKAVFEAPTTRHGPGLSTHDAGEAVLGADLDPFITVSLYDMAGPTFPPHPHAGFAVATYMLPESPVGFVNQDSLGNLNAIPPGALHVTVAGTGVQHEEQPAQAGQVAKGFQIWIDLKNGQRQLAPHALHLAADQVPVIDADGASVRVVLGSSMGMTSPLRLPTDVRLIDVTLQPGATFAQALGTEENAFLFVLDGEASVNGAIARGGELVRTAADGDALSVRAGADGARFILFAGQPYRQPRAQRGPFVASDAAELHGFMTAFSQGRMGRLTPFSGQRLSA
jgi:redox-sensitive bicupin YhaK (pirin superfamily)